MQSRKGSFIESMANIVIGYVIAVSAQALIFPLYGIHIAASSHLGIGLFFTVVSFIRGYTLRRIFNRYTEVITDVEVN